MKYIKNNMRFIRCAVFGVIVTVAGYTQHPQRLTDTGIPRITLSIFSGRTDPMIPLTAEAIASIYKIANELPITEGPWIGNTPLYYGGFRIGPLPTGSSDNYVLIRVFRRIVEVRTYSISARNSTVVYKHDEDRTFELTLLSMFEEKKLVPESRSAVIRDENRKFGQ